MRHYDIAVSRPALTGLFVGVAVLGFIYVYGYDIERFRPEYVRDLILAWGAMAPAWFVVANIVRPFICFPAAILAIAGGLAFGPLWGTVYLVVGTVLGAAAGFGVARLTGWQGFASVLPRWKKLRDLDALVERRTFETVLFVRLVPVMPWDAVTFVAGLSKARFRPYLWATVIGSIPGAVLFCLLGDSLRLSLPTAFATFLAAMVLLYLPTAVWWHYQRNSEEQ